MGLCQCQCNSVVFIGSRNDQPLQLTKNVNLIQIKAGHNRKLYSILSKCPGSAKTILYFHGNAEDAVQAKKFTDFLQRVLDVNVVIAEYPGYGIMPEGEANVFRVKQDSLIYYDQLQKSIGEENIVIIGRSIGSGPASFICEKYNPAGLILISPFLSLQEVALDHAGCFGYLLKQEFNNFQSLNKLSSPVLLIHGVQDEIIKVQHSQKMQYFLRDHGKQVSALYPPSMTHNRFKIFEDVIMPIRDFLLEKIKWDV